MRDSIYWIYRIISRPQPVNLNYGHVFNFQCNAARCTPFREYRSSKNIPRLHYSATKNRGIDEYNNNPL